MADVFVEKVIEDGPRNFVKSFSYTHVDAGQSAVMAIDVSDYPLFKMERLAPEFVLIKYGLVRQILN